MLERVLLRLFNQGNEEINEDLIQELLNTSQDKILIYISENVLPKSLETICVEMTLAAFNRLGSEGITTESVSEVSYTYNDDLLKPYKIVLDRYIAQSIENGTGKGTVTFV